MKTTTIISIFFAFFTVICVSLLSSCSNSDKTRFFHHTDGFIQQREGDWGTPRFQTTQFSVTAFVRNLPADTLAQLQAMMRYADKISSGFEAPRHKKNNQGERLSSYRIWFIEIDDDVSFSRRLLKRFFGTNTLRNLVGNIALYRSSRNSEKWEIWVAIPRNKIDADGRIRHRTYHFLILDEYSPSSADERRGIQGELMRYLEQLRREREGRRR